MKIYKMLEDYYHVPSKENIYLKKDDILIVDVCTFDSRNVTLLTKLIRGKETTTLNIVDAKLSPYGMLGEWIDKLYNFDTLALGVKERISGTLNGFFELNPIKDVTNEFKND